MLMQSLLNSIWQALLFLQVISFYIKQKPICVFAEIALYCFSFEHIILLNP